MSTTVPVDSLKRFLDATPEQRAAIDRYLLGALDALPSSPELRRDEAARLGFPSPPQDGCPKCGDRFAVRGVFRRAGSHWRVVLDGGTEFHLEDTLGARYLDYLLHHPNESISAFDLEVAIRPEKAEARARSTIQAGADPDAARAYLRELSRLRKERDEAAEAGRLVEAERLDGDIEALESALRGDCRAGDTGERARSNVNKALAAVRRRLAKGGKTERAFAEHVERFVSVGYECMYAQESGRSWE